METCILGENTRELTGKVLPGPDQFSGNAVEEVSSFCHIGFFAWSWLILESTAIPRL